MKQFLYILPLFLLLALASCSDEAPSAPEDTNNGLVGQAAPNFTYTSLGNEQFTLSQLQGNVVYIFFFGANCPHCRDNGPVTENTIYQRFKNDSNFVALGLDTWNTSAGSVSNFKDVTGISYPLLLNARQSLIDYYGNTSDYDRSVVIAADGTVAYQGTRFVNRDANTVVDIIEEELAK